MRRALVGLLLLLGSRTALAQLPGMVPFDVRSAKAPTAVRSGGREHLIYELRISNISRRAGAIRRIEVLGSGQRIAAFEGDTLKAMLARVGESGDGRVLAGGHQVLAYLHVRVAPGAVPDRLDHRLVVAHGDSLETGSADTLGGIGVEVDRHAPAVLASPLTGGPWLAANGPGNTSGHRRTVIPLEGSARIPQRFATDWIKLGPDGTAWRGDSTKNANWFGYGEPLLAVADGRVVAVKDGIIENVPFSPTMAVPITLETVGGNHVILDIGGGRYAFYAHLIPGSVVVRVGDRVKAGQQVGRLGNSGNSTAPHLHFHLGDAPSPLGTEGLPFVVDEFQGYPAVSNIFAAWKPSGPAAPRKRELPLENEVVVFRR